MCSTSAGDKETVLKRTAGSSQRAVLISLSAGVRPTLIWLGMSRYKPMTSLRPLRMT